MHKSSHIRMDTKKRYYDRFKKFLTLFTHSPRIPVAEKTNMRKIYCILISVYFVIALNTDKKHRNDALKRSAEEDGKKASTIAVTRGI